MTPADPPLITELVHYAGRVQGVGFRYTTRDLARNFPVTGYVQNLPDGRVELLARGTASDVDTFLNAVADRFRGQINGIQRRQVESAEEFPRFEIRY